MSAVDWIVMLCTLTFIVVYGLWKTRHVQSTESFILGDRELKWYTIGLSIMATQASAITFLSAPGQAFDDGMGFAQFYFGLPIAMVLLCVFVLPIYYRLRVYTAYEFLEQRFDVRVRMVTAFLFLVGRGLAAGITIYAPAIILSVIMGWSLWTTILFLGVVVIVYTMFGGTTAVSQTQKQQMIIIMGGLVAAFIVLVSKFPADISVGDAVTVAGKMGKLEIIDLKFDPHDRYNIWTAIFGGTFLFLSYFGTDQSQVSRYLSGKSLTESRLGLLFNGIFKVPMQFMILFVGLMVFMFYQFEKPPIHFNPSNVERISASPKYQAELDDYQMDYDLVYNEKQSAIRNLLSAIEADDATLTAEIQGQLVGLDTQDKAIRSQVDDLLTWIEQEDQSIAKIDTDDGDYIFITFVMQHLPIGLIGLLLAVIFSAAMSSTASELNALASCTIVDFYRRSLGDRRSDSHYLQATKLFTLIWGAAALLFAGFASLFDNLIEFVNIIGSLFYGTILGIFVIAFFFRKIQSNATLMAAIVGEIVVVTVFILDRQGVVDIAYLWLNLIGCVVVITTAAMLSLIFKRVTS
jgi:SSS family transporter